MQLDYMGHLVGFLWAIELDLYRAFCWIIWGIQLDYIGHAAGLYGAFCWIYMEHLVGFSWGIPISLPAGHGCFGVGYGMPQAPRRGCCWLPIIPVAAMLWYPEPSPSSSQCSQQDGGGLSTLGWVPGALLVPPIPSQPRAPLPGQAGGAKPRRRRASG